MRTYSGCRSKTIRRIQERTRFCWYFLALTAAVLCSQGTAEAVISIFTKVGDKTVLCEYSGLTSNLKDCTTRWSWYTYAFVGLISRITPSADEESIEIVPEEIFHGNPGPSLTVLTSQAVCLPKLAVGDRWLFFLRKQPGKPIVLDAYGNQSNPVSSAQEQIQVLRRLQSIGDFGILRGMVSRSNSPEEKAIAGAIITAKRISDGKQFVSQTDANGRYEFQPVPPGKYSIIVGQVGSFQADASEADVTSGSCWDVTLSHSPHGLLAGHVKYRGDSPRARAHMVLISADDSWFQTTETDEQGYFEFASLPAGKYVIGMNPPDAPAWPYASGGGTGLTMPTVSLYYANAFDRSVALVIELSPDEQRNDLDFNALHR